MSDQATSLVTTNSTAVRLRGPVKAADKAIYLEAGASWEDDQIAAAITSKKVAWIIASIAAALAVLTILALFLLVPLKTIEPLIIETDPVTGETKVRQRLTEADRIPVTEALNKYWSHHYIQMREGYSRNDFNRRQREVLAMSSAEVARQYTLLTDPKSEQSPYAVFGNLGTLKVFVHSIMPADDNTVVARTTIKGAKPNERFEPIEVNITLSFIYTNTPKHEGERLITPLGFQVTHYRIDPVLPGTVKPS